MITENETNRGAAFDVTAEPSIESQLGAGVPPHPNLRRHERPHLFNVKFQTLDGFEFWITPYNHIFLVNAKTGQLGQPWLTAPGEIAFEPPMVDVPVTVLGALGTLLGKQRRLRSSLNLEREDDDRAWDWS